MDLSRIGTAIGLISLAPIVAIFVMSSFTSPLGSLSLPCITMLTSFFYFYLMPAAVFASGDEGVFGMYLSDLTWTHTAVLLYVLGAGAAFLAQRRVLNADPALSYPWDLAFNRPLYLALWGAAIAGNLAQSALGMLNITGEAEYRIEDFGQVRFLAQSTNLLVPLTLVFLIRQRFRWWSLLVLAAVLFVFLQAGFRFRIMILLAGVATAYALQHRIKIGIAKGVLGIAAALPLAILLGSIRRYAEGIDLSALNKENFDAMSESFGGELSLVYVLDYLSSHNLPPLVPLEPWLVAISRLVPTFLWPDKPLATYYEHFIAGASLPGAELAGIAAPQHAEMLVQMGWWGLAPLAFLYFSIACWLVKRFAHRGPEVRLAGCALVPAFFGFYMQTRGYFFQILADGLFILGPLFLLNLGMRNGGALRWPEPRSNGLRPPQGREPDRRTGFWRSTAAR